MSALEPAAAEASAPTLGVDVGRARRVLQHLSRNRRWLAAETLFVCGWGGIWASALDVIPHFTLALALALALCGLLLLGLMVHQDTRAKP